MMNYKNLSICQTVLSDPLIFYILRLFTTFVSDPAIERVCFYHLPKKGITNVRHLNCGKKL